MQQARSRIAGLAVVVISCALIASCGAGGSTGGLPPPPPTSTPGPSGSSTRIASLGSSPANVVFGKLPSGVSGSVTFPATANGSATVTMILQSALPTGIIAPQSVSRHPLSLGGAVTALAYMTFSPSANLLFTATPTFTLTAPTGTLSGNVYLALYNPDAPAAGWYAIAGPVAGAGASVTLSAQQLQQAFYAGSTYVFAIVESSAVLPPQTVPMGTDYGLRRQCIRTPSPGQANFYFDNVDCPGGSYPTARLWNTYVEIDTQFQKPCIGPSGQSWPINSADGLVSESWHGSQNTGYSWEIKVDFTNVANPCPPPTISAFGLVDNNGLSNGLAPPPFPRPDQARLQFDATYNRTVGTIPGGSHVSVETDSVWTAAGFTQPVHVEVQVDIQDDPEIIESYGTHVNPPGTPPDVLFYYPYIDQGGANHYFMVFDGSKLAPAITLPVGVPTHMNINYGTVIAHVLAENLAPPPQGGWANSGASTNTTVLGLETINDNVGAGGPMMDLVVSNFQNSAQIGP